MPVIEMSESLQRTKQEVNNLAYQIVGAAIEVHKKLGPGLLESVYHKCLNYELKKRKLNVEREKKIELVYDDVLIDEYFRVDLLVENLIIVEVKSVEQVHPIYKSQLLTYLNLAGIPKGLLINFNCDRITDQLIPMVSPLFASLPDK